VPSERSLSILAATGNPRPSLELWRDPISHADRKRAPPSMPEDSIALKLPSPRYCHRPSGNPPAPDSPLFRCPVSVATTCSSSQLHTPTRSALSEIDNGIRLIPALVPLTVTDSWLSELVIVLPANSIEVSYSECASTAAERLMPPLAPGLWKTLPVASGAPPNTLAASSQFDTQTPSGCL